MKQRLLVTVHSKIVLQKSAVWKSLPKFDTRTFDFVEFWNMDPVSQQRSCAHNFQYSPVFGSNESNFELRTIESCMTIDMENLKRINYTRYECSSGPTTFWTHRDIQNKLGVTDTQTNCKKTAIVAERATCVSDTCKCESR